MTMAIRVLLVDDDESNRLTLSAVLEDEGYEVREASSVPEAEGALSDPGGGPFAVAVLDQHIGKHLGTDLAVEIRRRSPATKILLLSGSLLERPDVPLDAFVTKGDDVSRVLSTLRSLLP